MSETTIQVPFPVDDEGFFRRECPYCRREFKILLERAELGDMISQLEDSYLVEETSGVDADGGREEVDLLTCPYCGQQANRETWWTQEQLLHVRTHLENLVADVVNEQLIQPLKREFGRKTSGPLTFRFEGRELEKKNVWMSPESSDMKVFDLPCCGRKVKIDPEWSREVRCLFCGFSHARKSGAQASDNPKAPPPP